MKNIQKTPEIGMGATEHVGSDKYPYSVVVIVNPKKIVVRRDEFIRTDQNGMSECQMYAFSNQLDGAEYTLTLRKNGRWVPEGTAMNDAHWFIGERDAYQDPSF